MTVVLAALASALALVGAVTPWPSVAPWHATFDAFLYGLAAFNALMCIAITLQDGRQAE